MTSIVRTVAARVKRRYGATPESRASNAAPENRESIAFIHIGKNAGTAFMAVASQINAKNDRYFIEKKGHLARLSDLGDQERYVFSIRSPMTRFISGFYSRKRKGQPRIYSEWSKHEALAFANFEHANDLAEALFEPGHVGHEALCAMKSISHTSMNQVDWFSRKGHFLDIRPPITVIRKENFAEDVARFVRVLDLDTPYEIPEDPVRSHKNDYTGVPTLSDKSQENLRIWYAQDIEFYRHCEAWLEARG